MSGRKRDTRSREVKISNFTDENTPEVLGLDHIPNAVFSKLIISQFAHCMNTGACNVHAVLDVIKAIQSDSYKSKKGLTEFRGKYLNGFHKAHWFEARFIAKNLMNHWKMDSKKSDKMTDAIKQAFKATGVQEGNEVTSEAVSQMTYDIVQKGFKDRAESKKLTGEWIIFRKEKDRNVYLTLASHREKDVKIFMRMAALLKDDYPGYFSLDTIDDAIFELKKEEGEG